MKKVKDLFVPLHDAINYNANDKKGQFIKSYNCTIHYDRLKEKNCYFIIGDKGSGKTALALYHQLNSPNDSVSKLLAINSTQYKQFIMLKVNKKLEYTDYSSIWRATLLVLMSQLITQKSKKWIHRFTKKFSKIEDAMKKYDEKALLPQINTAIELATTIGASGKIKALGPLQTEVISSMDNTAKESTETIRFHINEAEKALKEGLSDLKLSNDFVVFLDGLDARPADISQEEFQYCIQGLYDALWQLNTDFFQNIRDSKGRMRFCLLIRPDIFEILNAYNSNSRISDNSLFLTWQTTETDFEKQSLFQTMNKFFVTQNNNDERCGWKEYFPSVNEKNHNAFFSELLKRTFIRPRDYFSVLEKLIRDCKNQGVDETIFPKRIIESDAFKRNLSDYILGEIKNYMNFYISNSDFSEYIKFFQYLDGNYKFTWNNYCKAYEEFKTYMDNSDIENRSFYKTPIKLLQFFFDSNLVGYYQTPVDSSKSFIFWSYREKTPNNLSPKVKENVTYIIFEGVRKSLDVGKRFLK